jgi:hypothetical protein
MAIKGVAMMIGIESQNVGVFKVSLYAAACDGLGGHGQCWVDDVSASALSTTINDAIADAAKTYLANEHGVSFGPLDTVRVLSGII